MILTIDNFDGSGPRDYTAALAPEHPPRIRRRLNQPSDFACELVANDAQFIVPANGGRLILQRSDGTKLFTGYLIASPAYDYLGWGERGPLYRYSLAAHSDEFALDRKLLAPRSAFINRTAGSALAQLAADLLPGAFDTSGVQSGATIPSFGIRPAHSWSAHAAALAARSRAAYRAHSAALVLAPVGVTAHAISESS